MDLPCDPLIPNVVIMIVEEVGTAHGRANQCRINMQWVPTLDLVVGAYGAFSHKTPRKLRKNSTDITIKDISRLFVNFRYRWNDDSKPKRPSERDKRCVAVVLKEASNHCRPVVKTSKTHSTPLYNVDSRPREANKATKPCSQLLPPPSLPLPLSYCHELIRTNARVHDIILRQTKY